ncbi:hypothetical protein C8A05DRAFT_39130 [Staphylotrichum tortipilum]|uniref:Uncharacterized protein n=1 Tax=Staphylotrichum tortipilum TaxID=2831512 RepID=A0AAN6MAC2_9PEZI|nr:hypothetical protein C8A05DRAFT_39130 [Staphylotrichum longicolle]
MLDLLRTHLAAHDEDQLLNNIWMGLLGVEALMVLGVAVRGLVGAGSRMRERRRSASTASVTGMDMDMGMGMSAGAVGMDVGTGMGIMPGVGWKVI